MKKFAKILSLVLAMLMIAGCFAGCGNLEPEETPGQPVVGDGPEDLNGKEFMVAWWGADARHNNTMAALKEFDKTVDGLKTQVKYSGWGEFFSMIDVDMAGNTAPDVFQMTFGKLKTYAQAGKLLKLDDYIASGALDMSNVAESSIALGKTLDGVYAIPTGINCTVYVYSTEATKAAGVTLSRTPTLDELITAAKKVYDKTGMKIVIEFEEYVRMRGESYYNEEGNQIGFSAQVLADWWKFEKEGIEYGYFTKPEDEIDGGVSGLTDGKLWCFTTYSNQITASEESSGKDLEWMAVPCTDANKSTSFVQPNTLWVISAQTDLPQTSLKLVNFFTNNPAFYDKCGVDRGMPISSKIIEHLEPTMTEDQKLQAAILEEMEQLGAFGPLPNTSAKDTEAKTELTDYMQMNKYNMIPEAEMLAYAEEAIQAMNDAIG